MAAAAKEKEKQCWVNPQTNKQIQEGCKKWTDLIDKKIMPIQTPCLNVNNKLTAFLDDLKAYTCEFTKDKNAQQSFYFQFFRLGYGDAFFVHFLNNIGIKCASEQIHVILRLDDAKTDGVDFEYGYRDTRAEDIHALKYKSQCDTNGGFEVILIRLKFRHVSSHILQIANTTLDPDKVRDAIRDSKEPVNIEHIWHRTAVLVDHTKKTVEYFEPYGYSAAHEPETSVGIQSAFIDDPRFVSYKYIIAAETCPVVGVQGVTNDQFCQNWALLYIILRLKNPSLSYSDVQTQLSALSKEDLVKVIEGFMCYLMSYIQIYHLDTIMDWYNDFQATKRYPKRITRTGAVAIQEDSKIENLIVQGNYTEASKLVNEWQKKQDVKRRRVRRSPGIMSRNKTLGV